MPNWCTNNITISGPTETIQQLWKDAESGQDGASLLEAMAPIGNWDYGTAVDTWGTKWDISLEGLEFIDHKDGTSEITGYFDSAWAPPIGAYDRFLDDMDNCSLDASYFEPGMDFAGFYSNGDDEYMEELSEESRLPEDEQSELFKRIDEEFAVSGWYEDDEDEEEVDLNSMGV